MIYRNLKKWVILKAAHYIAQKIQRDRANAQHDQTTIMHNLVREAKSTAFGLDHGFKHITNYEEYKQAVPVREYEDLKMYIQNIIDGQSDVLWSGRPRYFAKTSGTTSGIKYIPISKESMPNHIETARNAMLNYFYCKNSANIFDGQLIFLSGSPELELKGGIKTGRLSGIVHHEIPAWVRTNQLPSNDTNRIEDWETKLDKIVKETVNKNMTLISGIPPWVQMYYEKLLAVTGKKTIKEVFPNYNLFMYGGVNYEPYRHKLESLVGQKIDSIETYPASEGFIAFQEDQNDHSLLLNTNSGIFYEFIPLDQYFDKSPPRLNISQVNLNTDYALIMSTNAGLWAYSIGDCVRFTSLAPYKILVSGRVKHYISAFGEHVIGKEVEQALNEIAKLEGIGIIEFTVAPQVNPQDSKLPYHEWFISFDNLPDDMAQFSIKLDNAMRIQNIYYDDLIQGGILRPLIIRPLAKDAFIQYMKNQGKLGGQNKVPRLSNDRKIADKLMKYLRL